MDFLDVMNEYFRGERMTGLALIPVGLAALGFAVFLWRTHSGGFLWGAAIPILLIGLGGLGGGAGLALKTPGQVSALRDAYREDPAKMVEQELPRMRKVNANWPRLKIGWTVIAVVALGMIWGVGKPWSSGLGASLLLFAALLMTIDIFAERRADPYTRALEQLARGP